MTGRDRRATRRMIAERQTRQMAEQSTPRSADLPAVAIHPAAPPQDMDQLLAPIEFSPNLAQPVSQPGQQRRTRTPSPSREPLDSRRAQAPHAQPSTLDSRQYVALRLLEALVRRDGADALNDGAVKGCIRAAERILR